MPSNTINITIKNLPEIKSAFNRAPKLMSDELNIAIKKTAVVLDRQSMINTPVRTGRLRSSTYMEFGNLKATVGTNTNYDVFVHNGTRFMKARPYLYDAAQETSGDIEGFFTDAVNNVLSSIGKAT